MIIGSLRVENLCSILDETIECDNLTVLVGRNGTGKSSFLRALELFYDPSASVATEDFYGEDETQEILIALTFTDLNEDESTLFAPYLEGDQLTVVKVFSQTGRRGGTYHGMRLQNPEFVEVRNAGSKTAIRDKYGELKATDKYSSLPVVRSADQVEEALRGWEASNPDGCEMLRDDGQFFGFTQVAQGYLGRFTRFIRIPAVRDASQDATEGRGTCVTEILDLVVRNALAKRSEYVTLKEDTQKKYDEVMDPAKLPELATLETQLSETLRYYAPQAAVVLEWMKLAEIELPLPKAAVKLMEDGYKSPVQRTGHGLQRAFILTMLQHMATARRSSNPPQEEGDEDNHDQTQEEQLPCLVLAIEEPELYQHPSRQRHMANVLAKLASGTVPGVAKQTQILYSTHSPLFVGLERFDQIRLLRKVEHVACMPKVTVVTQTRLQEVADELQGASEKASGKYTADTLRPRLQAVMTPWVNEGFFADVAVLVEGEDDRAAILGVAASMGHDCDGLGIAVIPCIGKNNLDRPLVIFRRLGIPVYLVWDGDCSQSDPRPADNRRLLRLVGAPEEDWPCAVEPTYACFKSELGHTLSEEIGSDVFDKLLAEQQDSLGIARKSDALKNPVALMHVVEQAAEEGCVSATLNKIVEAVVALAPRQEAQS